MLISVLNLVSLVAMIIVNALATLGKLGASTKEISNANPSLLMPTGWTFSIAWSLIYLFLIVYAIYQLVNRENPYVKSVGLYFLLANILNALWILAYHGKMQLISVAVIIGLFVVLMIIVNKLSGANFLIRTTFSLYYGWISVAMFVSILSYISSIDPNIYNSFLMRIATCVALAILVVLTLIRKYDLVYSAIMLFAMIGILVKHIVDFKGQYPEVIILISIGMLAITLLGVRSNFIRMPRTKTVGGLKNENLQV